MPVKTSIDKSTRSHSLRAAFALGLFISILVVSLRPTYALADETGGDDFGFFVGEMLPNQIDGVRDILPVFGGRYAFGLSSTGSIEMGLQNSHAHGVDFTTVDLDYRAQFPVSPGINAMIYIGPAFNYYSQVDTTNRVGTTGIEFGVAGSMSVGDVLALRADLKFMGGPGTTMYLLFGVSFKTSSSGQ